MKVEIVYEIELDSIEISKLKELHYFDVSNKPFISYSDDPHLVILCMKNLAFKKKLENNLSLFYITEIGKKVFNKVETGNLE